MQKNHIVRKFAAWSVGFSLCASLVGPGVIPALADGNIVDDQTTSVATNLGLFGGQADDIAVDGSSDAVYFSAASPSGVFSSTDSGDTWSGLSSDTNYGVGKGVEVDQDSGRVYALIGDTLLRSDDFGVTWENITSNTDGALYQAMVFGQERLLVAMNNGNVAVSEDGGDSFEVYEMGDDMSATYLAASTLSDAYYAAVTDGTDRAVYMSTDGGQTWTDMDVTAHGVTSEHLLSEVSVDPLDSDHLVLISFAGEDPAYQTVDGGGTWTELIDSDFGDINGTHATFDGTGRLYVGSVYSDDPTNATPNWTQLELDTPESQVFADIFAVDPEDTSVLYTNSSYGIARSSTTGTSWEDLVNGVTMVKVYDIAQASDKNIVWIGANGGLAKTENFLDSSPTWEYPILPTNNISNIYAVWVQPDDSERVVMGGSTFFYYSDNGGSTWSQSAAPGFSGSVQDIIQSNVDSQTLYAIFSEADLNETDTGGVFMSEDLGETWTDLSLPDDLPAVSLAVALDDTLYVGIGGDVDPRGIYIFSGGSWSALANAPQNPLITSVLADDTDVNVVYATTSNDESGGAFYKSSDAGATWDRINSGLENINNLDSLTAQPSATSLYLSGQDGDSLNGVVYKSTDQGESWSLFYTGLKQENFYSMLFDGLLLGNDRGLYGLESKASLSISKSKKTIESGEEVTITGQLNDAATGKKLTNKKVKVFKKVGDGEWKVISIKRTGSKGKVHFTFSPEQNTRYKLRWIPGGTAADEYTSVTSSTVKVTVSE